MPTADASTYPLPPVPPPAWSTYTAESIPTTVSTALEHSTAFLDALAALPKEQRTFDRVFRAYALETGKTDRSLEPALFLQYVATDEAVRDASVEADKKVNEWGLEAVTRLDVYQAMLDAQQHTLDNGVKLNDEEKRLMERLILERKRNGLGLAEEKRKEYLEIKKKIMALEIDFQRHCNEEKGFQLFTREELEGVPEDVIKGFPEVDGKLKVSHKTPDYVPVITYAVTPSTRKRMNLSYESKTLQNAPLLREIVRLRHKAAQLLGYANHAAYTIEVKMAKTPGAVDEFLKDLEGKLRPLGEEESGKLLALKKEEHEKRGWPVEDKLYLWDYRYLDNLYTERTLALDQNEVKAYFPVSHVVPAVLGIYKALLGVEIVPVPRTEEAGGETWHEGAISPLSPLWFVQTLTLSRGHATPADAGMYAVWTAGKVGAGDEHFIGYMHLDLFPREAKYGHA
ncbi:hypothetical protein JCM10207_004276, partial [Rhodosporidiobolus poonsookiae]